MHDSCSRHQSQLTSLRVSHNAVTKPLLKRKPLFHSPLTTFCTDPTVNSEPPDEAVHAAMNASVQIHRLHSSSTTQRQVPDARNGLRGGQSAKPDFIAAIDSNRRGSQIRFVKLTVSQNAHRAGAVERNLTFLQPTPYKP